MSERCSTCTAYIMNDLLLELILYCMVPYLKTMSERSGLDQFRPMFSKYILPENVRALLSDGSSKSTQYLDLVPKQEVREQIQGRVSRGTFEGILSSQASILT